MKNELPDPSKQVIFTRKGNEIYHTPLVLNNAFQCFSVIIPKTFGCYT